MFSTPQFFTFFTIIRSKPNPKNSPISSNNGIAVPIAKIGGRSIPIDVFKVKGIKIPKNSQNMVGQKPKEKATPIIKLPIFPPTFFEIIFNLSIKLNPTVPRKWMNPNKNKPIKINNGPSNFP